MSRITWSATNPARTNERPIFRRCAVCSQHLKQLLIGLPDLAAEKLYDPQDFAAEQDRKTKRCVQSFPCGNRRTLEVGFSH